MRFILITLLVVSSLSCDSVSMSINTNLPLFNRSSFEIVNTSDYYLEVSVNGRKTNFKTDDGNIIGALPPAESASIFFWNWSSYSAEASITVKAKNKKGKLVYAAYKKIWIYYNYRQAEVWIVSDETFRENAYYR